jgi:lysophosphatidylglycerol acyltransferase 1
LWTSHGNFFINGGVSKRKAVLQEFQQHLKAKYWRYDYGWVVMYPEGSRLYLIQEAEVKFAEKNGLKPFRYCAHPRAGAAHAVLNICGPQKKSCANDSDQPSIEYIVDCTLGYPNGQVVNLGSAMVGEWPSGNSNVAIHYSIHKVDKSFGNEEMLKEWLYKRYEEKDKLLEQFYLTGRFPGPGRQVNFPLSRGLFVQAFWLGLFYFHYHFWMRPLATLIINTSISLVN